MNAVLSLIESDTRPTILVRGDRVVVGCNRAARTLLPHLTPGADLAPDSHQTIAIDAFIRRCAATRGPLPGAIAFGDRDAEPWHVEGGVVSPASAGTPAIVVLRLRPRADARREFMALTQKITELNRELHTRRRLQAQLEDALRNQEMLLQEVHHRVKNNLQVVASML